MEHNYWAKLMHNVHINSSKLQRKDTLIKKKRALCISGRKDKEFIESHQWAQKNILSSKLKIMIYILYTFNILHLSIYFTVKLHSIS